MPARRKLARTSKLLGLPTTRLKPTEVRLGSEPITSIADTDRLEKLLERLAERVAVGTARTYRSYIRAWWSLCERRDADLGDDALLRGWLRAMTTGPHAWGPSSTRVAMAAVTAMRGVLDLPAPRSNHGFRSWFDGELLSHLAAPPVRKAPLLRKDLFAALRRLELATRSQVASERLPALRDQAIILLGFSAALRRSELAAVRVDDVRETPAGGRVLLIRKSKTDQQRQGQTVPLYPSGNPRHDVWLALQRWQTASGIRNGPLFRRIDRHGHVGSRALNPTAIRFILKRLRFGTDVSPHSLRRGFITEARLAGASNVQIRRVSRHKDDRMLDTYTADVDSHKQGPGALI